jgi:hypothetical protein
MTANILSEGAIVVVAEAIVILFESQQVVPKSFELCMSVIERAQRLGYQYGMYF